MVRYGAINDYGGHSMVYRERPTLTPGSIKAGKPTIIDIGVYELYSLPIGTGADDEWIKYVISVPRQWDGASNITLSLGCVLDTAQTDATDGFRLRLEWEHFAVGSVFPITSNTVYTAQTTGIADQYMTYRVEFTIDYDIDGVGNEIKAGESLGLKIWREAVADGTEITGEVMIGGPILSFNQDKIGVSQ